MTMKSAMNISKPITMIAMIVIEEKIPPTFSDAVTTAVPITPGALYKIFIKKMLV